MMALALALALALAMAMALALALALAMARAMALAMARAMAMAMAMALAMDNILKGRIDMIEKDKAIAALCGFAVGDALGATTEFMSAEQIKKGIGVHKDITGGGWLHLEPGQVTDDTEMALCVARSLVQRKCYDGHHMANELVGWYNDDPIDIGRTCRSGIHRYIRTGELERPASHDQAGNGALMRVLPFALRSNIDPMYITLDAVSHAHLTHNNASSDSAIHLYLTLVIMALDGVLKCDLSNVVATVMPGYLKFIYEYDGKSGGYVVESMLTVLHCFFTTTSFEEALIKCANLGGDADTNCAILGGLAGAYYGLEGNIPGRWIGRLDPDLVREIRHLSNELTGGADGNDTH